jgi:hypothetical protein
VSKLDTILRKLERDDAPVSNDYAEARESGVGWSVLAGKVVKAYKLGGFMAAVVYGKQGSGKSVYTIKVGYDALRRLGILGPHHTTRDVYKRYMFFTARQLISKARRGRDQRIPLLIWDDAGVHGGSYMFFTDPLMAKAIADTFKVIRTRVSALLMSTPNPSDILKPLRGTDVYIIYIKELDDTWSRAHGYMIKVLPSGTRRIKKLYVEDFKRRLRTYNDYLEIRDRYVDIALDNLERVLEAKELERLQKRLKLLRSAGIENPPNAGDEDVEVVLEE